MATKNHELNLEMQTNMSTVIINIPNNMEARVFRYLRRLGVEPKISISDWSNVRDAEVAVSVVAFSDDWDSEEDAHWDEYAKQLNA